MIMCPEFPRSADARLYFVDDEQDVVFFGERAETAEEGGRGVVVAAFGLDGFYDHGAGWEVVRCDYAFHVC